MSMQGTHILAQMVLSDGDMVFPGLVALAVLILVLASAWRIFTKADKPGWAALIPFYNVLVLLEIIDRPPWWLIFLVIPGVNAVFTILITMELVSAFGKDILIGILTAVLPFIGYPLLAFGDAEYQGPKPLF